MNRYARNQTTHHINISALAQRFGIPLCTGITPELLACYGQSPASVATEPPWLVDLIWTARRALTGLLACRRESTDTAELYHIEFCTFFPGRMEPEFVRCCVVLSGDDDGKVHLTFRLASPPPQSLGGKKPANKESEL